MTEVERIERKLELTHKIYQLQCKVFDFQLPSKGSDHPFDLAKAEARLAELRAELAGLE